MKRQSGFTLIEILIALLILAFVMTVIVESWGGSFRAVKKARRYTVVTMLLQRKVTEFELLYKNKTIDDLKEEEKGDFGSQYPDYKWEIRSKPFVLPEIAPPKGASSQIAAMIAKTLVQFFEQAVKEVAVSVIYRPPGSKEVVYTVTTLFVDFNKELPDVGL